MARTYPFMNVFIDDPDGRTYRVALDKVTGEAVKVIRRRGRSDEGRALVLTGFKARWLIAQAKALRDGRDAA